MNELLQEYLPVWLVALVHPPYMFAIWALTEWLRYKFEGIDNRVKPKYLVLIIGLVLGVATYFEGTVEGVSVPFITLVLSYFLATFLYDVAIKPLKSKFFPWLEEKQKQ